jgi:putative SOS response-associated peptidase YedK
MHPVIRQRSDGVRGCHMLRWGLVPAWVKDEKQAKTLAAQCINARAETAATKPAFREAFQKRRCLIPADGYYEWQEWPNGKQPFRLTRPDDGTMTFAGLWERWKPEGRPEALDTFAIITTDAGRSVARVHDRMPAILEPDQFDAWLTGSPEDALAMLKPWDGDLTIEPVNRAMSNWRNERPEDAAPIGPAIPADVPPMFQTVRSS